MRGLAIGHACGDSTEFQPLADAVARSAAAALRQAGADPAAVGYLELSGGALASDNLVELDGLTRFTATAASPPARWPPTTASWPRPRASSA